MNKAIISGRLVKDIELRTTPSGKSTIQNSLAVRNDYKNKEGKYDSEFINIEVWNNTADYLSKYATKGSKILVEGKIVTRNYIAQDGTKRYVTNVVAEKIELLDTKKETTEPEPVAEPKEETPVNDPFTDFRNEVTITDDDLPF